MKYINNDININVIKIIIADDEIKTCEEIRSCLSRYNQIKILGIANTDNEEIKMIEKFKPDVVVTDLMRERKFTGLDIIIEYSKQINSPKFVIVSFNPDPILFSKYKNITGYVYKFPKINGSELAYKIICAKRIIWKENQEKLENKK